MHPTSDMSSNESVTTSVLVLYQQNESLVASEGDVNLKIAVVFMLSVFSVVGVVGNAIAFYIFFGRRSMSTSVFFILTLAGTDFVTCLVTIPYTIVFEVLRYNLVYDLACKTYMFLITSTVPFSAYIMVAIALDRYFCICHPFLYAFTVPRAKAVVFCMGIPAVIFGLITALSHGTYAYRSDFLSSLSSNISELITVMWKVEKDDLDRYMAVKNLTNVTVQVSVVHYGQCVNNTFIISHEFLRVYEKIHALNFLFAYLSVAVLYILIYKSIFTRRVNKAKRRKSNLYPTASAKAKAGQREETQMTAYAGASFNSPRALNNQSMKDGKSSRKITLTARNDPSVFGKPEGQASCVSCGTSCDKSIVVVGSHDELNRDESSRDANGYTSSECGTRKVSKVDSGLPFKCEKCGKGGGEKCVYDGREVDTDSNRVFTNSKSVKVNKSVYFQPPHADGNNCVYLGPQTDIGIGNSVYTGPQTDKESTGPQNGNDDSGVYIGPQSCGPQDRVYGGPRTENNVTNCDNSPHKFDNESGVYIGPQASTDSPNIFNNQQSQKDEISVISGPQKKDGCVSAHSGLLKRDGCVSAHTGPQKGIGCVSAYSGPQFNEPTACSGLCEKVSSSPIGPEVANENAYNSPQGFPENFDCNDQNTKKIGFHESATNEQNKQEMLESNEEVYQKKVDVRDRKDEDISRAGYCTDRGAPEQKPLLPRQRQFLTASQDDDCPSSPGRGFSITAETSLTGETTEQPRTAEKSTTNSQKSSINRKRVYTLKDRDVLANIKTAMMLFIVTLVFLIAFLPALLMANDLLPLNLLVFYSYFIYNVVNPFIYAFMNQTFREDLTKLMKVCNS